MQVANPNIFKIKPYVPGKPIEEVKRELGRDEFIKEDLEGQQWFTTNQVLAEEKRLIDFIQSGRGKFQAFRPGPYHFQDETLSDEQRKAVLHILNLFTLAFRTPFACRIEKYPRMFAALNSSQ